MYRLICRCSLTTAGVCLLLAGKNVREPRLLLSLVQNMIPVGCQKCAPMKVHCELCNVTHTHITERVIIQIHNRLESYSLTE